MVRHCTELQFEPFKPSRDHCIVLLGKTLPGTLTLPFLAQVFKWVPESYIMLGVTPVTD